MRIAFLTASLDEAHGWGRFAAGFLDEARRRHGAENVIVPDPAKLRSKWIRWQQPFLALGEAWRLRRELRACDVIHAAIEPVAPLAFFLSILLRKPYVVSIHGTYGDLRTYAPNVRWLYRLAFGAATRLLPVSAYTADVVRKRFPNKTLSIVPGGFKPSVAQRKREAPNAPPRIISVGAIKRRKGFHALVEAFGILKKEGFRFYAEMIGPKHTETYVEGLEARLRELGLADDARLTGQVTQEALDRAYADADLFVMPAEHNGTHFEGLGLVYLEALTNSVPVIGCTESGAEDVIRDGMNGALVPPGQPELLAQAIKRILNDAGLWKRMSDAGPESVERFRWERVGEDMTAAYRAAIDDYGR